MRAAGGRGPSRPGEVVLECWGVHVLEARLERTCGGVNVADSKLDCPRGAAAGGEVVSPPL